MKIDREFNFPARLGFERIICSDGSMFFRRWETPTVPPKPVCIGSVLLVRSSQNRYRIAAQRGSESVAFDAVSTLKEVVEFVESFFA